ncbi:MAG TPA: hypothetical protein VK762_20660 [Polyangiaceae bacterium]|nr:hypothetical protein [Polyangiaceae bacterium]
MAIVGKCITLARVRYVWDPKKARGNYQNHSISFEEAVTSFADPLAIIADDLVVFIEGEDEIRLITARLATRPEWRRYEKGE